MTGTGKQWVYHTKLDELKRTSPGGLVPTLIPVDPKTGIADETKSVYESIVTIEYIDNVSGARGKDRLVSEDPFLAARARVWADKVNRECCSTYYGVLVRKDEEERRDHFKNLIRGLENFSAQLESTSGPTFLPDGQLSNVDLTLLPWAYRYYVLEHYRGPDFVVPQTPSLAKYHKWFDHVMNLDSVKRTLPDKDKYLNHIGKYADGSARSKVANAVRRGVAGTSFDAKRIQRKCRNDDYLTFSFLDFLACPGRLSNQQLTNLTTRRMRLNYDGCWQGRIISFCKTSLYLFILSVVI